MNAAEEIHSGLVRVAKMEGQVVVVKKLCSTRKFPQPNQSLTALDRLSELQQRCLPFNLQYVILEVTERAFNDLELDRKLGRRGNVGKRVG